jgi:hypothetical protein
MIGLLLAILAALPMAGTQFKQLPDTRGKAEIEHACYTCHSPDLLAQQRLTPKQWTATVEKMMRWGAELKESDKQVVIDYLSRHFGPDNRFTPTATMPMK